MEKDPHCYWCGIEVIFYALPQGEKFPNNFATTDHLYDRYDFERRKQAVIKNEERHVLACYKCNEDRGKKSTKAQSKDALRIREKLGQQRKKLGDRTPRSIIFRGLNEINKWSDKQTINQ